MPIDSYSVLKGRPTAGKVVRGRGLHYQITVQAQGGPFTVAVNIESTDGSQVLFDINHTFTPPDAAALAALATGVTPLQSAPGGLALDFVREQTGGQPMVTLAEMTLLPVLSAGPGTAGPGTAGPDTTVKGKPAGKGRAEDLRASLELRAQALQNAVTMLIGQAIRDKGSVLYAFGSAFSDGGRVDGLHNIHMNQGNPLAGGFAADNGIWQDGALLLRMPSLNSDPGRQWVAVFIAFQTESWTTDDSGNPLPVLP